MNDSQKVGLWGEILAVRYLRDNGYSIYNTNCRVGHLEVDIVAEKDKTLCVVEVKTRRPNSLLPPSENVDAAKRRNLENAAVALKKIYSDDKLVRFDIIEVSFESPKKFELNHIINAF